MPLILSVIDRDRDFLDAVHADEAAATSHLAAYARRHWTTGSAPDVSAMEHAPLSDVEAADRFFTLSEDSRHTGAVDIPAGEASAVLDCLFHIAGRGLAAAGRARLRDAAATLLGPNAPVRDSAPHRRTDATPDQWIETGLIQMTVGLHCSFRAWILGSEAAALRQLATFVRETWSHESSTEQPDLAEIDPDTLDDAEAIKTFFEFGGVYAIHPLNLPLDRHHPGGTARACALAALETAAATASAHERATLLRQVADILA